MNSLSLIVVVCFLAGIQAQGLVQLKVHCPEDDGKTVSDVTPFNVTAGNCGHYCEVANGKVTLKKCKLGHQYSLETNMCESSLTVNCPYSRCSNIKYNLMYIRADSCWSFFSCGSIVHAAFWDVCMLGRVWDQRKNVCTWDKNVCKTLN